MLEKANRNALPLLSIISQTRQLFRCISFWYTQFLRLEGTSFTLPSLQAVLLLLPLSLSSPAQSFGTASPSYPNPLSLDHTHHQLPLPPHHSDSWRHEVTQMGSDKVSPFTEMNLGEKPYCRVCQLSLDKPWAQTIKPISPDLLLF